MNIQVPNFIKRLFGFLHRATLGFISILFWLAVAGGVYTFYLVSHNSGDVKPSNARTYAAPAPQSFSMKLNVAESTAAEGLSQQQRLHRMVRATVKVIIIVDGKPAGHGSGVILDNQNCLVATNEHVVRRKGDIQVALVFGFLPSGEEVVRNVPAVVVGVPSTEEDLALLQLAQCEGMPWAYWGNPRAPGRGASAVAIGSPAWNDWSVTFGNISHPARFWEKHNPTGFGLIQTDAAINLGNSGGGLFLASGHLVGINSMIQVFTNNIGVARSTSALVNYIHHVQKVGAMTPRALVLPAFTPNQSDDGHYGLKVDEVPDELDYVEGQLEVGDMIIGVDGRRPLTHNHYNRLLWASVSGVVTLSVLREAEVVPVKVNILQPTPPPEAEETLNANS